MFVTFVGPCSLEQDGAETKADPGPAGPDSDAEKFCEWDESRETETKQWYAETAAAGGAVRRVHHWNTGLNQGH